MPILRLPSPNRRLTQALRTRCRPRRGRVRILVLFSRPPSRAASFAAAASHRTLGSRASPGTLQCQSSRLHNAGRAPLPGRNIRWRVAGPQWSACRPSTGPSSRGYRILLGLVGVASFRPWGRLPVGPSSSAATIADASSAWSSKTSAISTIEGTDTTARGRRPHLSARQTRRMQVANLPKASFDYRRETPSWSAICRTSTALPLERVEEVGTPRAMPGRERGHC